ncbi:MAG: BON domain-containing protein, partial [Bdellovibrio sp.]|nr:BON domain-containing protein [Bdellovibrio sp.]
SHKTRRNQERKFRNGDRDRSTDYGENESAARMSEAAEYHEEEPRREAPRRTRRNTEDEERFSNEGNYPGFYNSSANNEHLHFASPDYNTGYTHDANRALPRDFVASSNYERSYVGRGPRSFKRTDERVREDIAESLARHHAIDATDIEIEVKGGKVTLEGSVPERRMRYMSEDVAVQTFGVREVTNHIRVASSHDLQERLGMDATIGKRKKTKH